MSEMGIDTTRLEAVHSGLRQVESRQSRLADLYIKGSMPGDILGAKSEELNRQRMQLEGERRAIETSRPEKFDLNHLAGTLPDVAARLRKWVSEASADEMELILQALQLQVAASRDQVKIEGTVPVLIPEGENFVTIAQTSA